MRLSNGTSWTEVDTPRLLVDLDRLENNVRQFHRRVVDAGTAIRSHVKTHKTPRVAQMQVDMGAVGIAAAKVSEAEVFVDHGITDVVIAYPIFGPGKWRRAAALAQRCTLTVHVENRPAVRGLSDAASAVGATIPIRVEIDTGFHRTGVDADRAAVLAREILDAAGLEFDGVTSHRSIFFPDAGDASPESLGRAEGRIMVEIAEQLRDSGIEVPNVVAGSTPTGPSLATVEGITEVCAGTYVFYDAGMGSLGVNRYEDIALAVAARVVARPLPDRYTIDAGAKTFTKDTYPDAEPGALGQGGTRAEDVLVGLTDEHGIVQTPADLPALGAVEQYFPMHVCPVVNLADELVVVRDGQIVDVWPVRARGKNR